MQERDLKISIIIPCYNVEKYIDRCMDSIAKQSIGLQKLEIILVNDASTDGTWEKICSIEKKYPDNIIAVNCENNGKQGRARNIGMTYATAEYVGFVDSDDWIENDMYEILYNEIVEYNSDIVCCKYFRDNGKKNMNHMLDGKIDRMHIDSEEKRKKFIVSNCIGYGVWDKLYKRSFLLENSIYFPENLAYEDIFFSSLYYIYAEKISIINYELYHYFVNENSTVLNKNARYHYDITEITKLRWSEYKERGLLEKYKDELEYDMLISGFFAAIKIICLRFDNAPYDLFFMVKMFFNENMSDIFENKYIKNGITDKQKILLDMLKSNVTEEELVKISEVYNTIMI